MRTLKYFLSYSVENKARVNQLDIIGELSQAKFRNRLFVKWTVDVQTIYQIIQATLEDP